MKDKKELGLEVVREMFGEEHENKYRKLEQNRSFGSSMGGLALECAFGSVWAREGLDRKCRSMVTLGILIALRQLEELKKHVRAALANGCSVQEIEEAIIHTVPYAGFPAASQGMTAAREVLTELSLLDGDGEIIASLQR